MDRLISEQAVLDAIYMWIIHDGSNYVSIKKKIKDIPSADIDTLIDGADAVGYRRGYKEAQLAIPSADKWIPVSEKLPSDCNKDWVLAQIQEDNGYLWIPCVAEYRKGKDDWYSDANNIGWLKNHKGSFKVIAWMPLPSPFEPQESEG